MSKILPQILLSAAVFFIYAPTFGQNGTYEETETVQLLSSYEGKITDMVFISASSTGSFTVSELCPFFEKGTCCDIVMVQIAADIQEHRHHRVEIRKLFFEFGHKAGFEELERLSELYKDLLSRVDTKLNDQPHFTDSLVHELVKRTAFSNDTQRSDNRNMVHYLARKITDPPSQILEQFDKGRKDGKNVAYSQYVEDELVPLANKYLTRYESVLDSIYKPRPGCFPPFFNIGRYCMSTDANCLENLAGLFASFAQDQLYGLTGNERKQFGLTDPRLLDSDAPIDTKYLSMQCQCNTDWSGTTFDVDIPGGNILVADKFVLIGRDELEEKFLDTTLPKVRTRLAGMDGMDAQVPKTQLRKDVTQWLEKRMCADKKIIWVGLDTVSQRYHNSPLGKGSGMGYAPMYHIDVFLSLLGRTRKTGDSLLYMLAMPDTGILNMQQLSDTQELDAYLQIIRDLRQFISETADRLEKEVRDSTGVKMKRITVPLPFYMQEVFDPSLPPSSWIAQIFTPTNGFVENDEGNITYYMPENLKGIKNLGHINYKDALKLTEVELKKVIPSINIKMVPYDYSKRSGLHCLGKVIGRTAPK